MKKLDAKNKSAQELNSLLAELKTKLVNLSFDLNDKKLKDTTQIGKAKKDIARVLTQLNADKARK